jgi:hypothetical protein
MANTVTAFNIFAPFSLISSARMNENFANMRGDFIPIAPSTAASTDGQASLGLEGKRWNSGYLSSALYLGPVNTAGGFKLTPAASNLGLVVQQHNGSSYVKRQVLGYVNVVSKASNYTVSIDDDHVLVDTASAGAFTLTLPSVSTCIGKRLIIEKTTTDFNACTIDGDGSETIGGSATTNVCRNGEIVELLAISTGWKILSRKSNLDTFTCTFTGTWVSNATYAARCTPFGGHAQFRILVSCTGAPTSSVLTLTLPSGLTIDTTRAPGFSANGNVIGSGVAVTAGGRFKLTLLYNGPSVITVRVDYVLAATYVNLGADVSATAPVTFANGDVLDIITDLLPITNWKAS